MGIRNIEELIPGEDFDELLGPPGDEIGERGREGEPGQSPEADEQDDEAEVENDYAS